MFHVMNRAVHGTVLFRQPADYAGFMRVLTEAGRRYDVGLLAYCVMPNHWHMVLRPGTDHELSRCLQWLTMTHAQRWRRACGTSGRGAVYQGRFRWVAVEHGIHFLRLCRYVEQNALRAKLTRRAEEWPWCSAWQRCHDDGEGPPLADWPVPRPAFWIDRLNAPWAETVLEAIRTCMRDERPYGSEAFRVEMAERYGVSLTPRGRRAGPKPSGSDRVTWRR